jgi:hypothetical protein
MGNESIYWFVIYHEIMLSYMTAYTVLYRYVQVYRILREIQYTAIYRNKPPQNEYRPVQTSTYNVIWQVP